MKFIKLIKASQHFIDSNALDYSYPGYNFFKKGAEWMEYSMCLISPDRKKCSQKSNFKFYGWLKYLSCIGAAIAILYLTHLTLKGFVLAFLFFYFVEIQFLFLFPLLIDGCQTPVKNSIQMTFNLGWIKVMFTVIAIAIYMLIGLLNLNQPFKNWYVGCTAILLWYYEEA